jgi:hypothetical protein
LKYTYRVVDSHGGVVIGHISLKRVRGYICIQITDVAGHIVYLPIDQMLALERV